MKPSIIPKEEANRPGMIQSVGPAGHAVGSIIPLYLLISRGLLEFSLACLWCVSARFFSYLDEEYIDRHGSSEVHHNVHT
jgi:hypothetical protein